MPLTLIDILATFFIRTNENVRCPRCQERCRIGKNGFYGRFHFCGNEREQIQRDLCRNGSRRRVSFSIPPHPFLPRLRVSRCFLTTLWERWSAGGQTIASLARQTGQCRREADCPRLSPRGGLSPSVAARRTVPLVSEWTITITEWTVLSSSLRRRTVSLSTV